MFMKRGISNFIKRTFRSGFASLEGVHQMSRICVAQGVIAARQIRQLGSLGTLADAEFCIFSQWGEDGIIEWLVHNNGPMPEVFVEFGVENYREANTRFLLIHRNWRGLVIDGSEANMQVVKSDTIYWRHDLRAVAAFITKDNINDLITSAGISGEIGILSVDIDGNDYWVWDAVNCVNPQFVITEYNAVFGDLLPLTVPYDPAYVRGSKHHSNLYYGASIVALEALAKKKGYTLLGTNRAGVNAFFVRNDLAKPLIERVGDRRPRPSRFRECRDAAGNLNFTRGAQRATVIAQCPVVNLLTGETVSLGSIERLYSERWKALLDSRCVPSEGAAADA
jgi:hypothetical protein